MERLRGVNMANKKIYTMASELMIQHVDMAYEEAMKYHEQALASDNEQEALSWKDVADHIAWIQMSGQV